MIDNVFDSDTILSLDFSCNFKKTPLIFLNYLSEFSTSLDKQKVRKNLEIVDKEFIDNLLDKKQDKLISGNNISTINGQDITKGGNIEIKGEVGRIDTTPDAIDHGEVFNSIYNKATGQYSHAEGIETIACGYCSHAEGNETVASGILSHAEGCSTTASGDYSHAEGCESKATSIGSHAEGGFYDELYRKHAGGYASGKSSHAEGAGTIASGDFSHAEGRGTTASGLYSHAECEYTTASGDYSHAEGSGTTASGNFSSHAEGWGTKACGIFGSHSEGRNTIAKGENSHAEGRSTISSNQAEHAEGKFNKSNANTVSSIGIGTSDEDRKNAVEVTWGGNIHIYGIGDFNGTNPSDTNSLQSILNNTKQDKLVSGTNIATINNQDITKGGNIEIKTNTNWDEILNKPEVFPPTEHTHDLYLTEHQDISNKVDKVNGKSLIEDTEIQRLKTLKNYDDTDIKNDLTNIDKTKLNSITYNLDKKTFVIKEEGKGLSTNDYTTLEKEKLATLENYNDAPIKGLVSTLQTSKVDKSELNKKLDLLVNTVNIKSINGESLLGKGNIEIKSDAGGVLDAPNDGKLYTRGNLQWNILPEIPTKISLLTNDSNFITQHQDISTLATKEELNNKANKEHTHSLYLTEHLSLVGYAKENWVKNEIANASLQGDNVDLSGLATKEELTLKLDTSIYNQDKLNFATKDEIPSLDGYLKEIPTEYVTETELNNKNYLTFHQDISGKLDKIEAATLYQKKGNYLTNIPEEYVTSTELAQEGFLKEHQSLIGYAKETWVTQKITDALLSGGEVDLTPYATKEELKNYQPKGNYLESIPPEYITEDELTQKGYLTEHQDISGKLNTSIYNIDKQTFALKTELPKDYLTAKDIANKVDKSEISDMETKTNAKNLYQPKGNYLTQHQSLTNYALKTDIKTKTSQLTNDSGFITSSALNGYAKTSAIPTKVSLLTNDKGFITGYTNNYLSSIIGSANGEVTFNRSGLDPLKFNFGHTHSQYLTSSSLNGYAKTSAIPTKVSQLINDKGFITGYINNYLTGVSGSGNGTVTFTRNGLENLTLDTSHTHSQYLTSHQSLSNYYTKGEVNTALDGKANTGHTHNVVQDAYDGRNTTFAYSQPTIGLPTYLAGWKGSELRAVDSNQFWTTADFTTNSINLWNEKANKSDIKTKTSELINDSNFITLHLDISGKLDKSVYNQDKIKWDSKLDALTSENSKTINGESLLGAGNFNIIEDVLDNKFYVRSKNKWEPIDIPNKQICKVTITLKTTLNPDSLKGSNIIVIVNNGSPQYYEWQGSPIEIEANHNDFYIIKYPNVVNTIRPDDYSFVALGGTSLYIVGLYKISNLMGVYILRVNGNLYTINSWNLEWNLEAVGVYLGTSDMNPIIIAPKTTFSGYWQSNSDIGLTPRYADAPTINLEEAADYCDGYAYTQYMLGHKNNYSISVIPVLNNTINYKFKDGRPGYLVSPGEILKIFLNSREINLALNIIKASGLSSSSDYWTSCLTSNDRAIIYDNVSDRLDSYQKDLSTKLILPIAKY